MTRTLVSIVALALLGCGHLAAPLSSDLVDAEYVIRRDGARSATVRLETPGDLKVRGGACSLVEARARYDETRADARADFTLDEDGHGSVLVEIEQKAARIRDTRMDVCLSTELPLDLVANSGVGATVFDLSGVQLRGFQASGGVGDLDVDFGDASVAQAKMSLDSGTGDVTVDAKRAKWTGENALDVDMGTGDLTVYLPRDVGVRVDVDNGVGGVVVRGLDLVDGAYVNGLSSSATDRLVVDIDAGIGDVTLIAG